LSAVPSGSGESTYAVDRVSAGTSMAGKWGKEVSETVDSLVDTPQTKAEVLAIGPANWFSFVARELAKHDMALFSSGNHDVILNRVVEIEHNALAVVVKHDEQTVELCRQIDLLRSYIGWRTPLPKIIICRREGPCPRLRKQCSRGRGL